jgi:hypothetical protein
VGSGAARVDVRGIGHRIEGVNKDPTRKIPTPAYFLRSAVDKRLPLVDERPFCAGFQRFSPKTASRAFLAGSQLAPKSVENPMTASLARPLPPA